MAVEWSHVVLLCLVLSTRETHAYMTNFDPVQLGSSVLENSPEAAIEVQLSPAFPFYLKKYDSVFVNDDGILTLGGPLPASVPRAVGLPIQDRNFNDIADLPEEQLVAIAPLWNEVQLDHASSTGTVYYRAGLTRTSPAVIDAEAIVKSCYIDQASFTATSGVVVTWDQVSNAANEKNSFQAILVYDSYRSFVIFYFQDLTYLDQNLPGLTQMGFNGGDLWGGLSYPFEFSTFGSLKDGTNCDAAGIQGVYVFRTDTEFMTSPGCEISKSYYAWQVSPDSGPMIGGNRIYIRPICNLGFTQATCVFKQGDTVLQVARDQQIVGQSLVCIPEPFFVTGDVSILLYTLSGDVTVPGDAVYTVKYTVEHPDDTVVTVTRVSPTSEAWRMAGTRLTINWEANLLEAPTSAPATPAPGADNLRISILQFDVAPAWEDIYDLGMDVPNTGSFSFTPEPLENVTQENAWGVIRVQRMDGYPVALYSDVHMLGYLLHQQYQNNPQQWASDECTRWDAQEDLSNDNNGVPSFLSSVPACPCTLQQARLDPSRFLEQRGGCAVNANAQSCTREGASNRICFLSTYSAYGAECCYDVTNNNLVFSLDDPTGGSSDKAAMLGLSPYNQAGSIPFLSHWGVDVMPYHLCCRWSGPEQCRRYLENRRSKGCAEYPHRDSALIFGDPHFITFDQRHFTFNGIGEYRVMEVSGSDFKLYGRTTVATDSRRDDAMVASFLNAVAMQETGSDVVHVELGYQRPLNIYYDQGNGFRQPDMFLNSNAYDPLFLKGVTVHFSSDFRQILVAFQSSKVVVVVQAFTYGISAEVIAVNADFPGTAAVTGLLGDMNGDPNDDIKGTNGALYEGNDPETLFAVVKEWTTSGNTIFHNHPALNSEDYQNASFVPVLVTPDPSSLDPIIANQLEATCRGLQECLYDMSVTQTVVAGQDCYKENADYEEVRSDVLKKVETCSYIPSPFNGQVAYSDDFKKNAVGTSVTFSCGNPKAILIGPQTRECQSGATWSNAEMPVCTETNCNTDDFKGADVIETGRDQEGNLRVVFGCPGTTVEYTLTCKGGEWQGGGPIDCSTGGAVGLSGGAIAGVVIGCLLGVVLIAVLVLFVLRRRETGVKDLENTGTKVNAPADNWGMDAEARDAAASIGTNLKHAREV